MNFYLLAASAWGVRKGIYAEKKLTGMLVHFEETLETGYNKFLILSKTNQEDKKYIHEGYKLYKKGVDRYREYIPTFDPLLLLEGLMYIEEGRREFLKCSKDVSTIFDKKILATLSEAL